MIGVGIDLVELDRFRSAMERTPGLVEKLFSDDEREYSMRRNDPTERLAVRFAAKEAVMKALGVGLFAFAYRDVEVLRDSGGVPSLRLTGRARELSDERGITRWHLSLTHTERAAQAIAIAE